MIGFGLDLLGAAAVAWIGLSIVDGLARVVAWGLARSDRWIARRRARSFGAERRLENRPAPAASAVSVAPAPAQRLRVSPEVRELIDLAHWIEQHFALSPRPKIHSASEAEVIYAHVLKRIADRRHEVAP